MADVFYATFALNNGIFLRIINLIYAFCALISSFIYASAAGTGEWPTNNWSDGSFVGISAQSGIRSIELIVMVLIWSLSLTRYAMDKVVAVVRIQNLHS